VAKGVDELAMHIPKNCQPPHEVPIIESPVSPRIIIPEADKAIRKS